MEKESIIVPQVKEFAESISEVIKLTKRPSGMLCVAAEDLGGDTAVTIATLGSVTCLAPSLACEIVKAVQGNGDAVLGMAVLAAIREMCEDKVKGLIRGLNEEGEKDNG